MPWQVYKIPPPQTEESEALLQQAAEVSNKLGRFLERLATKAIADKSEHNKNVIFRSERFRLFGDFHDDYEQAREAARRPGWTGCCVSGSKPQIKFFPIGEVIGGKYNEFFCSFLWCSGDYVWWVSPHPIEWLERWRVMENAVQRL